MYGYIYTHTYINFMYHTTKPSSRSFVFFSQLSDNMPKLDTPVFVTTFFSFID